MFQSRGLGVKAQESWRYHSSALRWHACRGDALLPYLLLPLTTCGSQERWSQGHESGRAIPAPHLLQHLGEPAQGCVCKRAGPTTCLLGNSMGKVQMPSSTLTPCHVEQVIELVLEL